MKHKALTFLFLLASSSLHAQTDCANLGGNWKGSCVASDGTTSPSQLSFLLENCSVLKSYGLGTRRIGEQYGITYVGDKSNIYTIQTIWSDDRQTLLWAITESEYVKSTGERRTAQKNGSYFLEGGRFRMKSQQRLITLERNTHVESITSWDCTYEPVTADRIDSAATPFIDSPAKSQSRTQANRR